VSLLILGAVGIVLLLSAATIAKGDEAKPAHYAEVCRLVGNNESRDSAKFTVGSHWRITCTMAKAGPQPDVAVFVDPEAGLENVEAIHSTEDGTSVAILRNPGTFHLSVIGFDAGWTVVVEDLRSNP
jgi:hypothetical protein